MPDRIDRPVRQGDDLTGVDRQPDFADDLPAALAGAGRTQVRAILSSSGKERREMESRDESGGRGSAKDDL